MAHTKTGELEKSKSVEKDDSLLDDFQHVFEDIRKGRIYPWKPRTIPDTR